MVYTSEYPFVYLTADVVAFAVRPGTGFSALMVKRGSAPYRGRWAFPGGFVDDREDVEKAARRELREETGIAERSMRLQQLGAYTDPRRDPRHRVISVAWLAALGPDVEPIAGDDASAADWRPVDPLLRGAAGRTLAFDHDLILSDAVERLRSNLERTNQAMSFLPEEFTIAELRAVYEAVWGIELDPGNFQRKVTGVTGLLEETGWQRSGGRGRPATLYHSGPSTEISPPLSRQP